MSNKIMAFKALGLPLAIEPAEWAARAALGWFTGESTGYRHVRFLAPGTQLRLAADGVYTTGHDVLADWVRPEPLSLADAQELARESLLAYLGESLPFTDEAEVGLTGGWDSRAMVSCLRKLGVEVKASVRGLPGRPDVVIARELAEIARLKLEVQAPTGGCRRRIRRLAGRQSAGRCCGRGGMQRITGTRLFWRTGGGSGSSG